MADDQKGACQVVATKTPAGEDPLLSPGFNRAVLEALPAAVYVIDREGRIVFCNEAAVELWGQRPPEGSRWSGAYRLYWTSGESLRPEDCPAAVCLREGRCLRGIEILVERPDHAHLACMTHPSPLLDEKGEVVGVVELLVSLNEQKQHEIASARLAAIVESSDDAIVSKTLEGRITSWNASAERIFGYRADEIVGQHITRIVPPELHAEEEEILARLRRGEHIAHFDTVRLAKDGHRLHVSLTVSPLRNKAGTIVGASKIARDITERQRAQELRNLLFAELNHRVKNMLATIQAIASQSLRHADDSTEFVESFSGRLKALARTHDLLVHGDLRGAQLGELVREQVLLGLANDQRVSLAGPAVLLGPQLATQLALVLHELATNARKYGALASPERRLVITWSVDHGEAPPRLTLLWKEIGMNDLRPPRTRGFGSTLIERTLETNGGQAVLRYGPDGLACEVQLPLPPQETTALSAAQANTESPPTAQGAQHDRLKGRRILLIEDEPLIAMELESELASLGCVTVGPAASLEAARRLIEAGGYDAALLDANLSGQPVDELAAALAQRRVPFAFATGYGREALPHAFRQAQVLTKPFGRESLLAVLDDLVG